MIRSPGGAATTSQFLICISRDLSMEAAILFYCHVVLRLYGRQGVLQVKVKFKNVEILGKHSNGREQSRHPFAVILLVTTLWRLPSCFAAILFCADTITRRRCGARSKVKGHRLLYLYNCQLGLGLVTLILSSVMTPITNTVGLVTLMKGQRSPTFCTYSIASWG